VVFVGNSITDGSEWNELFHDLHIKNRGISGDATFGILHRWQQIVKASPKKVFLMIGINDLSRGASVDSVFKNILLAADYLKQESPTTQLYIQSILPVTDHYKKFGGHTSKGPQIKEVNRRLRDAASAHRYTYVDLHTPFTATDGRMDQRYTNDGLHLLGEGYMLWKHLVYPYVYDLEEKPALIPLPQQLKWTDQQFPLYRAQSIVAADLRLEKEATVLQRHLQSIGLRMEIKTTVAAYEPHIALVLADHSAIQHKKEGYVLQVNANQINAADLSGVFFICYWKFLLEPLVSRMDVFLRWKRHAFVSSGM
jgi:lysophospholipase L1-like esterase